MESTAPPVTIDEAQDLTLAAFGQRATARPLYAERDRNFRLDCQDGERFLLKVSNADADPALVAFQVRALQHAAAMDPGLPIPRLHTDSEGHPVHAWRHQGKTLLVRLLSWLPGSPTDLESTPDDVRLASGRLLARLGRALEHCNRDGAPSHLPWDLANLAGLRDLSTFIHDPHLLGLVHQRMERFEAHILPLFPRLRPQVIHNDLNGDNLLVVRGEPDTLSGIIDFGDIVVGPLVADLAVAAAYQVGERGDPVANLAPLVRGYQEITPLTREELALLLPLTECRLITTLLVQGSRAHGAGRRWDATESSGAWAAHRLQRLDGVTWPG